MRAVVWVLQDQDAECALIGRPILEAMGINARNILEAFSDAHHDVVDVPNLLLGAKDTDYDSSPRGRLVCLLRDGIFHSQGGDDEGYFGDKVKFLEFGEDDPQEEEDTLNESIKDDKLAGMSEKGVEELTKTGKEDFEVFQTTT